MDTSNMDKLTLELRRGAIVLGALSQLNEPEYGYSLQQRLASRGMEIEQGTLYPLLRRLEDQGLLGEEWRIEDGRPRKYYQLTAAGREAVRELSRQWREMNDVMENLLRSKGRDEA